MVAPHVCTHNLVEGLVGNLHLRAEIGVEGRVADEHVDSAPLCARLCHEILQLLLVVDVAGDGDGDFLAALLVDLFGHPVAGVRFAARDHDLGAVLRESPHDRLADALRGAGDKRHFAAQIEQIHVCLRYAVAKRAIISPPQRPPQICRPAD